MELEELKQDLAELQTLKEQALAQVNAYEGAIQYVQRKIDLAKSKEEDDMDLSNFEPGAASHRPEAAVSEGEQAT